MSHEDCSKVKVKQALKTCKMEKNRCKITEWVDITVSEYFQTDLPGSDIKHKII